MHILLLVLFACVVVLLWVAFSIARHISASQRGAQGNPTVTMDAVDKEAVGTGRVGANAKTVEGE